jgi:hypothetical protein
VTCDVHPRLPCVCDAISCQLFIHRKGVFQCLCGMRYRVKAFLKWYLCGSFTLSTCENTCFVCRQFVVNRRCRSASRCICSIVFPNSRGKLMRFSSHCILRVRQSICICMLICIHNYIYIYIYIHPKDLPIHQLSQNTFFHEITKFGGCTTNQAIHQISFAFDCKNIKPHLKLNWSPYRNHPARLTNFATHNKNIRTTMNNPIVSINCPIGRMFHLSVLIYVTHVFNFKYEVFKGVKIT